jgi:GNAT superfamily N-acetyltransferase
MGMEIREVVTRQDWRDFFYFPLLLYQHEKHFVPPIISQERDLFDPGKNPALEHCSFKCWLVRDGDRVAGRIAGIINHRYNEILNIKNARFGWFDLINNGQVAKLLLNRVEEWATEIGMTCVCGPHGFTNFNPHGIMVEGFDKTPHPFTTYNFPYYSELVEKAGYTKRIEWVESFITVPDTIPEKMNRVADWVKSRYQLKLIDNSRMKNMLPYKFELFHLLNEAYGNLYGFVPLTDKQIELLVNDFLKYLKSKYISIVLDHNDKVAAFGISIPDISKALQKARGHLWPFGIFHIWRAMNWNDTIDLMLIAVRPDYQMKGVNTLLFQQLIPIYQKSHIRYVETLQNQIDNIRIQAQWDYFDRKVHRRSYGYIKEL